MPLDLYVYREGGSVAHIRLPGPFDFHDPQTTRRVLDPETDSWEELAVLLALRDDQISSVTAWKDARFRVELRSGRVISAFTQGPHESWEVSGDGYQIVGTPGEVMIWDEGTKRSKGQGGEELRKSLDAYFPREQE